MKRALLVTSLVCSALVGCGDDKTPDSATLNQMTPGTNNEESEAGQEDSSGGESSVGQDTGTDPNPTSTTTPPPETSGSEGGSSETGMMFIMEKDIPTGMCNPFTQDCPEGQKCNPYADDGGTSWNNNRCFPIIGDGVAGDACFAEGGGVAGVDDCDEGFFCWDVDAMMNGFCVQLCTGSPDAPECADIEKTCAVANEGTLPICLDACDPLLQDCDPSDVCIQSPTATGFLCVLDASGDEGQANDPCNFANACDPGLLCADPTSSNDCDPDAGCCQPFCDINEPGVCPDPQMCIPLQTPDPNAPEVGFCSIPI